MSYTKPDLTPYEHYFKPVPIDENFADKANCVLVDSIEMFNKMIDEMGDLTEKVIAFDTETTGLTFFEDKIVGFSISLTPFSGFYVPIRHKVSETKTKNVSLTDAEGNIIYYKRKKDMNGDPVPRTKSVKVTEEYESSYNLDAREALDLLYEKILTKAKVVSCHNAIFDMIMLKGEGYDTTKINFFDTMVLVYNADTNVSGDSDSKSSGVKLSYGLGLKEAAKHFLGRVSPTFKDTVNKAMGKQKTFIYVCPTQCYEYACYDTMNTLGLYRVLFKKLFNECADTIKMDNSLVKCFVDYFVENEIYIDTDIMNRYKNEILKEVEQLYAEILEAFGHPPDFKDFNINSKDQLEEAFKKLGLTTGEKTATGKMKLDKTSLENINHPVIDKLKKYNSLNKQLNTYIDKLSKDKVCHVNYKLFNTATGRLASGNTSKSKYQKNHYFIDLNMQNLTKPKPAIYRTYESEEEGNVLGWIFEQVDEAYIQANPNDYYVEGFSQELNVRNAITVPDRKDWYMLSLDYSAQELKLPANFSKEPNLVEPFKRREDLHQYIADKIKKSRKEAKACNFGLMYSDVFSRGKHFTLMKPPLNLSEEAAVEVVSSYDGAMTVLNNWKKFEIEKCKENNCVTKTFFGRPRRLKFYFSSDDYRMRSFGNKSVISHIIQGTGGDLNRKTLASLCRKLFIPYRDRIKFVAAVHDDISYAVRKDVFYKAAKYIESKMIFQPKSFEIPLDVSIEVGTSLGNLFPFVWDGEDRTRLVPKKM